MLRLYSLWRKILKETRLQNRLNFITPRAEAHIFAVRADVRGVSAHTAKMKPLLAGLGYTFMYSCFEQVCFAR